MRMKTRDLVLARIGKQDRDVQRDVSGYPQIKAFAEIPAVNAEAWTARLTEMLAYWARFQARAAVAGDTEDREYAAIMLADVAALAIRGIEHIEDTSNTFRSDRNITIRRHEDQGATSSTPG